MAPLAFRVSFMAIGVITLDVHLPKLHPGQKEVRRLRTRFKAVRCGRRWGKTKYAVAAACEHAAMGKYVGWFAPEYKFIAEAYREISVILANVKRLSSRDKVFTTLSDGRVDFWSLENELAGRSMGYHLIVIDEAAFTKAGMLEIWQKNLRPTLLDFAGRAIVCSNTNGVDAENFFWRICNQPEHGFVEYHAPSRSNPYLPREELEKLERENVPLGLSARVSRRVRGLVRRRVLRPGQAPRGRQACGGPGDLRWCVRDRGFGHEGRQRK
jgi:hypothetical protein